MAIAAFLPILSNLAGGASGGGSPLAGLLGGAKQNVSQSSSNSSNTSTFVSIANAYGGNATDKGQADFVSTISNALSASNSEKVDTPETFSYDSFTTPQSFNSPNIPSSVLGANNTVPVLIGVVVLAIAGVVVFFFGGKK